MRERVGCLSLGLVLLVFFDGSLSLNVWFRDGKDTTILDRVDIIGTAEESGMSLDVDKDGKNSGTQDSGTHDDEGILVVELTETESEADGTGVSSGTDNSGDGSSGRRVNVWDNSVTGSLSGLDENGEDNHDANGSSEVSSVGKDQDHTTLGEEEDGVDENTTTHSHAGVELVRGKSSKTTGEQVHPSKDRGDGGSRLGGLVEFFAEVEGGGVVHGQLNTEAASVLDEENPSVKIQGTVTERGSSRDLWHGSVLLHVGVVTLRGVIGDEVNHNTRRESNDGWDNRDSTPCEFSNALVGSVATVENDLEKREKSRSHDKLGDTSAEVTPTSAKGVGGTDDLSGKHTGRPVLAHDEGTSGDTNEETENGKSSGAVDETSQSSWDGSSAEHDGEKDAGTELVATRSKDETHEDGSSDTDNGGSPELLLGEIKGVLDLRQERGNGEPDEESNEETPPRAVEGSHVRASKTAKLDLSSLVILVRVDGDRVGLVLLDLLGLCGVVR
jgi:hypothetical protein